MVEINPEELKNMSPEQIRQMQKENCIFCHIISGKVQSKKVYEDKTCIAILDINPANPGHILLLPREHHMIMPQIPDSELSHLFLVAKHISHALLKALKAQGTNIFVANGAVSGQRSPHFMIHVVPRMENDGLANFNIPHKKIGKSELNEMRTLLDQKISEAFGTKKEVIEEKAPETIKTKPTIVEAEFKEEKAVPKKKKEKTTAKKKKTSSKKTTKKQKPVDINKLTDLLTK